MTRFASAAYFVNAAFAIVGGWALDRYIGRGGSVNFGYKTVLGVAHLGYIACMLCMALGPRPVAPALTGYLIDWTGHFTLAFVMAAAVGVIGFVGYVFMIPRVAELDWQAQTAGRSSIPSTRVG
jgi:hypothetical protein